MAVGITPVIFAKSRARIGGYVLRFSLDPDAKSPRHNESN